MGADWERVSPIMRLSLRARVIPVIIGDQTSVGALEVQNNLYPNSH